MYRELNASIYLKDMWNWDHSIAVQLDWLADVLFCFLLFFNLEMFLKSDSARWRFISHFSQFYWNSIIDCCLMWRHKHVRFPSASSSPPHKCDSFSRAGQCHYDDSFRIEFEAARIANAHSLTDSVMRSPTFSFHSYFAFFFSSPRVCMRSFTFSWH